MRLHGTLITILALLFAAARLSAAPIDVNDPPMGVFLDEWYAIMLNNQKSGHVHMTMERVDKHHGVDIIKTMMDLNIEIGRGGDTVSLRMVQETEETVEGQPRGFTHRMQMGKIPAAMVTQGRIRGGEVTIRKSQFGMRGEETTHPFPEGALMSWGLHREQVRRGLEPGTSFELPVYEPMTSLDKASVAKLDVLEREMLDLFGRRVEAVKTRQTMSMRNPLGQETTVESFTWLTEAGAPVRIRMELMNIPLEMLACSRAVALAPNDPAELLAETFIRPSEPLRADAKRAVYRLRFKDGAAESAKLPTLPDTALQRVESEGDRAARVTVAAASAVKPDDLKPEPLSDAERKRYLAASGMVNYEDPEVARLAKEAAGDEKDPAKLAVKLTRFVGAYVQTKDFSVGFASASEVARSREGDCSEHGVLLAALGRAHDIPTRVVTGLVYADFLGGGRPIFAGHLWTQFHIDGRWVDLDATRPSEEVGPRHIALSISDAGATALGDLVNTVWLNLGNLAIDVISQE